jgi:transcriptional regulator with XRE-family HTH domain
MDIYETRRYQLKELMSDMVVIGRNGKAKKVTQASVADKLSFSRQYFNALYTGRNKMGNHIARFIETKLELESGSLDITPNTVLISSSIEKRQVNEFIKLSRKMPSDLVVKHIALMKKITEFDEIKAHVLFEIFHKHLGV